MGVDASGGAAETAGSEELPVRRLMIDEAPQGKGVGFVANMPIGNPGELAEVGDRAGLSHACQAEIEAVGQEAQVAKSCFSRRRSCGQVQ